MVILLEIGMKKLIVSAMLAAFVSSPVFASVGEVQQNRQSVYRTVETITIMNDDGSASSRTVTTVYSVFGFE